jgi:annexin A7/11
MVNHQQVQQDIESLYRAGPGKIGTDEIGICGILLQRSNQHLQAIAQGFQQRHRISLSKMVESEFSGHMRDGLLHIARFAEADGNGVHRDALLLEAAMAGMGTKDERLCYRLCRMHWDRQRFAMVKNQYRQMYHRDLVQRVKGETSGKYENALVALITQN